jgi:hypothetical protein
VRVEAMALAAAIDEGGGGSGAAVVQGHGADVALSACCYLVLAGELEGGAQPGARSGRQ